MKATFAPHNTSAWCIRIQCIAGLTIRLTSYPLDLIMSNATVYKTDSGYSTATFSSSTGFSPAVIDLEGIAEIAGISRDQIASGIFDNARIYIFKCNYLSPVEDYEEITAGLFGKTTIVDKKYKIEGVSLIDTLNQSIGRTYSPSCSYVFGSTNCGKALGPLTLTGTITAVNSAVSITDSSRSEPSDYFAAGTIKFTSGSNNGLKALEIKSFSAGTIVTHDAFYYPAQIGDTYTIIPGCRKRREDCRDKWANIINFGGFPDMPLTDTYMERGTK